MRWSRALPGSRGQNGRKTSPFAVVWLIGIWVLLWGNVDPLVLVSGVLLAFALLWGTPAPAVETGLRVRPIYMLGLLAIVSGDLLVSSSRVAWLVVTPKLPPSDIFMVPLRVRGGLMITLVAICVSAVPGSTVVDTLPDEGLLEIHVLDASAPDAEQKIRNDVRRLERWITAAFGSAAERRRAREG